MIIKETKFKDAYILIPNIFHDSRGYFFESYKKNIIENYNFIQDNQSYSILAETLRGLHYQKEPFAQTKLVRVLDGSIYDVIVDLRKESETFGQWQGFNLTANGREQLLVPKGFAHGFITKEEKTRVLYKVDNYYSKEHDKGILWSDLDLNIDWGTISPILSDKDSQHPTFKEVFK
ncbi:MAG: dTDP-4-dehydrorhamnose 3,5-epimerase [Caulobacteraceae bacterium]|nr:dTDP-4-dehydrorhamnose 3,5-epimerase [Caulobacteraceae bacterium]